MVERTLVIQIPCYNEALTLPVTLAAIPRQIEGVSFIKIVVIDDGSDDNTIQVARSSGVEYVVEQPAHVGLAQTFQTGLKYAVSIGADIIVNLDADNQYCADDIAKLIAPIVRAEANVVIGERDLQHLEYISVKKRIIHRIGNSLLRVTTGLRIKDATSGFRAFDRQTAAAMQIHSRYTYTIEMLYWLQAHNVSVSFIPIRCNLEVMRPSRLIRSGLQYCLKTLKIVFFSMLRYQPKRLAAAILVGCFPFIFWLAA